MNFPFFPSLIHSLIVFSRMKDERGREIEDVAVWNGGSCRRKMEKSGGKPFFFLFLALVCCCVISFCYHIPHNWNFLRMCVCLLPPPPLSLFFFLQKNIFFFFPPTTRLELLPSPVLPHPARLNREKRTRTQGQSVFKRIKKRTEINKHLYFYSPLLIFSWSEDFFFLVERQYPSPK